MAGCGGCAAGSRWGGGAGGFDRGGVNIDLLFDDRPYAVEAGVTYVSPQRELHNVRRLDGSGLFSSTVGPMPTTLSHASG